MNHNKKLTKKSVFQIATVLSAVMLAVSAMSSLVPAKVFAQEDTQGNLVEQPKTDSSTQQETSSSGPAVLTSVQPVLNVQVDVDVIFDEENCRDASDQTNQGITQSSDQQGEGNPVVQTAVQTGLNVAVTPDVVLTSQCNPSDQTTQGVAQSTNQQGEGNPVVQTAVQDGRNVADDTNFLVNLFG
jgi:hypothetical protein